MKEMTTDQKQHYEYLLKRNGLMAKYFKNTYEANADQDPIKCKCIDCMGYEASSIKKGCNISTCPLWHVSPIKSDT